MIQRVELQDLSLRYCRADLDLVHVLCLIHECKGVIDKWSFVGRETCFVLLRELKPKFSYKSVKQRKFKLFTE